jgi:TRAP-type C4-dicarboxylate transport system permease small subunit
LSGAPRGALRGLARGLHWANAAALGASMVAMVAACIVLTGSVVLRYALHAPTDWQDEVAVFLLVFVTFGSSAWVQAQRGHIGIEALAGFLPARVNRLRWWLCDLVSLAFCAFFAWKSWTLVHEAWVEGMTTSTNWAPPLWFPYGMMAAGMSLLVLQLLLQVLGGPRDRESAA